MTLTDEQVEKAAEEGFMKRFRYDFEEERDWDELDEWERVSLRNFTRAALEAVMPGEPGLEPGELLPCPFCGGKPERDVTEEGGNFIECSTCGASTHLEFDRAENLSSHWNRRAGLFLLPAPEPGELERLREAARKARAVLAQAVSAGWNAGGPTPEDTEAAFWSLDAALVEGGGDE